MSEDGVVVFGDERGQVRLSYEPIDEDVGTLLVEMRLQADVRVARRERQR